MVEQKIADELDIKSLRKQFPIITGHNLCFLDSAASAQKPYSVVKAMEEFTFNEYANVHRGVYKLSAQSTERFEQSRKKVANFIGANSDEIVFTSGATASINLVANSFCHKFLNKGDTIAISEMEHHSNITPWQLASDRYGLKIKAIKLNNRLEIDEDELDKLLESKPKLLAITHVSNVTGIVNSIKKITEKAHSVGCYVLVDGAQAAPHMAVDVKDLMCDFYVFTGHKIYGPTGIGVLYGKKDLLSQMPPFMAGGGMIEKVTIDHSTWTSSPTRFEAGTPPIVEAVGLHKAIDFIESIGINNIEKHSRYMAKTAYDMLADSDIKIFADNDSNRLSILSFIVDDVHSHDIGTFLDVQNIQVRVGHHCAQPLMDLLNITGTIRASFGIYNDKNDIITLKTALDKTIHSMKGSA